MKNKRISKRFILGMSLLICVALAGIVVTCSQQSDTGAPPDQYGPFPSERVNISFYSEDGSYSIEADGVSTIKFIVKVTNQEGQGYSGVPVTFSTSLGSFSPAAISTNNQGMATTTFTAGCVPGGTLVAAIAMSRVASQSVDIYGDYPTMLVEAQYHNIGGAGYQAWATVQAGFSCSGGTAMANATIGFSSELGCFIHGCDSEILTNDQGDASLIWYPPVWGTNPTTSTDWNAPRSSVITATYIENGTATEYTDSTVIYVYPLHAKMWLGTDIDPDTQKYNMDPLGNLPVMVYVWWEDANGRYPQPGITVNLAVGNTTDTKAYLVDTEAVTDSGGYVVTYLNGGGTIEDGVITGVGDVLVTASIDETGPGNCCPGSTDGWQWNQHETVAVGGDVPCFVEFDPTSPITISASDPGEVVCADILVYVYDDNGALSNANVRASFDINGPQGINDLGCAILAEDGTSTTAGYSMITVCNGFGGIPCSGSQSDYLWIRIKCNNRSILRPYLVQY